MEKSIVEIAKLVPAKDILWFVIIVGLFVIIWFQEISFRKKDRQQSADLLALVNVINGISNQINNLAEILRFLSMARRDEKISKKKSAVDPRKNNQA